MIARRNGFEVMAGVVLYRLLGEILDIDCAGRDGHFETTTGLTIRLGCNAADE
jgi:hypothetical protein